MFSNHYWTWAYNQTRTREAFHYERPAGQRPVGLTKENGTTFSNQNALIELLPFHIQHPVPVSHINGNLLNRKVGQRTRLSKWNGKFPSEQSHWLKWTTSRCGSVNSGRTEPKEDLPFDSRTKFPNFQNPQPCITAWYTALCTIWDCLTNQFCRRTVQ